MTPEEYWNQDIQRQDQKFYTAFCLLGAACSDYAVGIDLRRQMKLNWSATALYYFLVHCGRLACFLALGDFPTGHDQLRQMFESGEVHLQRSGQSWMGRFKRFLDTGAHEVQPERSFRRDELVRYLDASSNNLNNINPQLSKWGEILSSAKRLREKSNYEGLLITHEHNHITVTAGFERLVNVFVRANETVLAEAIALMKGFLNSSQRSEHWYSFLNWKENMEGLSYLENSLLSRVNDQEALIRVTEFLSSLRRIPEQHLNLAKEVAQHVEIGVFGGKRRLMNEFLAKIQELERELGEPVVL